MTIKGICSTLNIPCFQSKVKDPSSRDEDGHLTACSFSSYTPSCHKQSWKSYGLHRKHWQTEDTLKGTLKGEVYQDGWPKH